MQPIEKISIKRVEEGKYSLDLRGFTCPYPEIFARRALDVVAPGNTLVITIDNAPSCETIPAAAEELRHRVIEVKKIGETDWNIVIQKQ